MLKVNITIEEKENNCQVNIQQKDYDKATKNEQITYLNIFNHLKKLFDEVDAKKTTPKKTTKKKKEEK